MVRLKEFCDTIPEQFQAPPVKDVKASGQQGRKDKFHSAELRAKE
jgi:hypothetical protein